MRWARHGMAGFTLVETLIVVFIMGLLASAVVLALPERAADAQTEALRFAAKARMAAEESIMTGRQMGLQVSGGGYAFFGQQAGRWAELSGDRVFSRQSWNPNLAVTISSEGIASRAGRGGGSMVVFDPAGASTPFAVAIESPGRRYVVSGDRAGDVTLRAETAGSLTP